MRRKRYPLFCCCYCKESGGLTEMLAGEGFLGLGIGVRLLSTS